MSLATLFHLLCAQHVSDINIHLQELATVLMNYHIGRLVLIRTKNKTTDVVIHQHIRKLLKMDILMSETCWAHNKWNKIASDIKLVFNSSTIAVMHGPINIRIQKQLWPFAMSRSDVWGSENVVRCNFKHVSRQLRPSTASSPEPVRQRLGLDVVVTTEDSVPPRNVTQTVERKCDHYTNWAIKALWNRVP